MTQNDSDAPGCRKPLLTAGGLALAGCGLLLLLGLFGLLAAGTAGLAAANSGGVRVTIHNQSPVPITRLVVEGQGERETRMHVRPGHRRSLRVDSEGEVWLDLDLDGTYRSGVLMDRHHAAVEVWVFSPDHIVVSNPGEYRTWRQLGEPPRYVPPVDLDSGQSGRSSR